MYWNLIFYGFSLKDVRLRLGRGSSVTRFVARRTQLNYEDIARCHQNLRSIVARWRSEQNENTPQQVNQVWFWILDLDFCPEFKFLTLGPSLTTPGHFEGLITTYFLTRSRVKISHSQLCPVLVFLSAIAISRLLFHNQPLTFEQHQKLIF